MIIHVIWSITFYKLTTCCIFPHAVWCMSWLNWTLYCPSSGNNNMHILFQRREGQFFIKELQSWAQSSYSSLFFFRYMALAYPLISSQLLISHCLGTAMGWLLSLVLDYCDCPTLIFFTFPELVYGSYVLTIGFLLRKWVWALSVLWLWFTEYSSVRYGACSRTLIT